MKIAISIFALIVGSAVSNAAPAPRTETEKGAHPCQQIKEACTTAGFIPNDYKKGDGLWRDCVDPIMQKNKTVPGASKPLPTVSDAIIDACKAKNPKFGSGKVGS